MMEPVFNCFYRYVFRPVTAPIDFFNAVFDNRYIYPSVLETTESASYVFLCIVLPASFVCFKVVIDCLLDHLSMTERLVHTIILWYALIRYIIEDVKYAANLLAAQMASLAENPTSELGKDIFSFLNADIVFHVPAATDKEDGGAQSDTSTQTDSSDKENAADPSTQPDTSRDAEATD